MAIGVCSIHQLPETVICGEGECMRRYCHQCFTNHNQQHKIGVVLNDSSKLSLVEWNRFLLQKFRQIQENIKTKGINAIFEMRLNSSYPKGLINEINNNEVAQVSIKIIQQYLGTLATNIQFISTRQALDELDIPELLKDIYLFFAYETTKGLGFLADRVQIELKESFKFKKIYEFVNFSFVPKQLRVLETKRKAIIKNIENVCLVQLNKQQKHLSPVKVSTPTKNLQKSPRMVSSGVRTYTETVSSSNNLIIKQYRPQIQEPRFLNQKSPQKIIESTIIQHKSEISQPTYKNRDIQAIEVNFDKQPYFGPQITKIQPSSSSRISQSTISSRPEITLIQPSSPSRISQPIVSSISGVTIIQPQNPQRISQPIVSIPVPNETVISPTNDEIKLKTQENIRLCKENGELNKKLQEFQEKLKIKEKSIRQLNNLISNQEEELHYRENEVEILTEEIKKLMVFKNKSESLEKQLQKAEKQLKFKQKSIAQLNNLICNEEEEIQFRENQVQTLTIEIKKLVEWKQRCQQIQKKLNQKQKQLDEREKGIKQLNNVIGNQQQQLAFRQSEVQMLTSQLKKASDSKIQYEDTISKLNQQNSALAIKVSQLEMALKVKQNTVTKQTPKMEQNFDEQLMEEVIELQSQVVARNEDIKRLITIVAKYQKQVPAMNGEVRDMLRELTTVKVQ